MEYHTIVPFDMELEIIFKLALSKNFVLILLISIFLMLRV